MISEKDFFITLEGIDGAGKTVQAGLLAAALGKQGLDVIVTREPGGTPAGERIRDINNTESALMPLTELFLMLAARMQHIADVIRPALEANKVVICDRFIDASIAYQGSAIDTTTIKRWNKLVTGRITPDITFLLDLPPEVAMRRSAARAAPTRMDGASRAFHHQVRERYLALAAGEPDRVKVIDATLCPEAIHRHIIDSIKMEKVL